MLCQELPARLERRGDVLCVTVLGLVSVETIKEIRRLVAFALADEDASRVVLDLTNALLTFGEVGFEQALHISAQAESRLDVPAVYVVSPAVEPCMRELCRRMATRGLLRVVTTCGDAAWRWASQPGRRARAGQPRPSAASPVG